MVVVGRWMKISTTLTTEHHILVVTAIQPACTLQACSRSPYMLGEFWIFVVACCTPDCGWCRLSVFHMTGRSKCHVLWILVQRIFNDFLVLLFFRQKPAERLLYTDNAIFMTIHPWTCALHQKCGMSCGRLETMRFKCKAYVVIEFLGTWMMIIWLELSYYACMRIFLRTTATSQSFRNMNFLSFNWQEILTGLLRRVFTMVASFKLVVSVSSRP